MVACGSRCGWIVGACKSKQYCGACEEEVAEETDEPPVDDVDECAGWSCPQCVAEQVGCCRHKPLCTTQDVDDDEVSNLGDGDGDSDNTPDIDSDAIPNIIPDIDNDAIPNEETCEPTRCKSSDCGLKDNKCGKTLFCGKCNTTESTNTVPRFTVQSVEQSRRDRIVSFFKGLFGR